MKFLKSLLVLAALALPASSWSAPRLGYIMAGPMLHWNFGGYDFRAVSYAFEVSWWTYERDPGASGFTANSPSLKTPGYGFDIGLEAEKKAFRFYAEPQAGWVYAGLSAGPVLELSREGSGLHLGVQGSAWMNALAGFDIRYRYVDGRNDQAIGLYGKFGALVYGRRDSSED